MPDTASITIVKAFTYRGVREEFSNRYHFTGTTPDTDAAWKTLADAVIAQEKTIMHGGVKFVRAYGYAPGNELSVAQVDYEAPPLTPLTGTAAVGSGYANMTPEGSLMIRWRTPDRNSRKKWIYLRKYYHGSVVEGDGDRVSAPILTAAQTMAAKLVDGTLPGGFRYCGPQGAAAGALLVDKYVVARELKRRGKRPSR